MALTQDQVELVRGTAPLLRGDFGQRMAQVFYEDIFAEAPGMNNVFNIAHQQNGQQARAVAAALHAYAVRIDDLGRLAPEFSKICHLHASMYIRPEQYGLLERFLLDAMSKAWGAAFTPQVLDAWRTAYRQLAAIFMSNDEKSYQVAGAHAWSDWRDFRISHKVVESSEITSFYLIPVDGLPLPIYLPGQFISINLEVPSLGYRQSRQYSLSDAPKREYYRISVKKEAGAGAGTVHPGYVSNTLHDQKQPGDVVKMSHPQGDFYLDIQDEQDGPVVLLSAGVGITPTISMLNSVLAQCSKRPVSFIHGARSLTVRAFHAHLSQVSDRHTSIRYISFIKAVDLTTDQKSQQCSYNGRLSVARLGDEDLHLDDHSTKYFICGPSGFMTDVERDLIERGVHTDRIFKETFGPGERPA